MDITWDKNNFSVGILETTMIKILLALLSSDTHNKLQITSNNKFLNFNLYYQSNIQNEQIQKQKSD